MLTVGRWKNYELSASRGKSFEAAFAVHDWMGGSGAPRACCLSAWLNAAGCYGGSVCRMGRQPPWLRKSCCRKLFELNKIQVWPEHPKRQPKTKKKQKISSMLKPSKSSGIILLGGGKLCRVRFLLFIRRYLRLLFASSQNMSDLRNGTVCSLGCTGCSNIGMEQVKAGSSWN